MSNPIPMDATFSIPNCMLCSGMEAVRQALENEKATGRNEHPSGYAFCGSHSNEEVHKGMDAVVKLTKEILGLDMEYRVKPRYLPDGDKSKDVSTPPRTDNVVPPTPHPAPPPPASLVEKCVLCNGLGVARAALEKQRATGAKGYAIFDTCGQHTKEEEQAGAKAIQKMTKEVLNLGAKSVGWMKATPRVEGSSDSVSAPQPPPVAAPTFSAKHCVLCNGFEEVKAALEKEKATGSKQGTASIGYCNSHTPEEYRKGTMTIEKMTREIFGTKYRTYTKDQWIPGKVDDYADSVPPPAIKPWRRRKKAEKKEPVEYCEHANEIPWPEQVVGYAMAMAAEKHPEQEALLRKLMGL